MSHRAAQERLKRGGSSNEAFGKLPSFLSPEEMEMIESGFDMNALTVAKNLRPRLEWLAEGFGLTPKWKTVAWKNQLETGSGYPPVKN